ncbi:MAG: serine hydrolase domain-containing protein [Pirellulaceae bacterium]
MRTVSVVPPESVGLSADGLGRLTEYLQREVDQGHLAGAVGLVMRHGQVAYQQAVGFRNIESQQPMQVDSLFRIASMSKAITSAGVLSLVEDGKIELNARFRSTCLNLPV